MAKTQVESTEQIKGVLVVANGGTGNATNPANSVLTGNGTGAVGGVVPGTSGNVLTSNGTIWASMAPSLAATPNTIASGATYTVADNTQVTFSGVITVLQGGQIITAGSGVLSWVN